MNNFESKYATIGDRIFCTYMCDKTPEGEELLDYIIALANQAIYAEKEATCKVENRPSDARSTTAWVDMPESPNDAPKDKIRCLEQKVEGTKDWTAKNMIDLNSNIMWCKAEIQMLWDAVEAMKERLPKEWGK